MALLGRWPGVTVEAVPAVAGPRQVVTARVATGRRITRVRSVVLDWGYTNVYRYHWAGRADSPMIAAGEAAWPASDIGTNATGERDAEEWVSVNCTDLTPVGDEFGGATATFRVPSWAPASSPELVRWACRVTVERDGRDIDGHGDFAVRVARGDVNAPEPVAEPIMGDRETVVEIDLVSTVFAAGELVRGRVRLLPTVDLPDGDIGVCWRRCRESHPLTRTPSRGGGCDGPVLRLAKRIPLRAGRPVVLPFALPLPENAAPSASAVHSSMTWFVQARLFYAGFSAHLTERVLRPIVVVNGPATAG